MMLGIGRISVSIEAVMCDVKFCSGIFAGDVFGDR
jgi:hypothetical protein